MYSQRDIPWPELIKAATRAPSGHNTQPWKFLIDGDEVRILPDPGRRLPVVDADDHALYVSLGCALENLVIAAQYRGFAAHSGPVPEPDGSLRARLVPLTRTDDCSELVSAIKERQTTRRRYEGRPVPDSDLKGLQAIAARPGVCIRLITSSVERQAVATLVEEGCRRQFSNDAFVAELSSWIRFSRAEAEAGGDGLTSAAMGLPSVPRWLGTRLMRWFATPSSQAREQGSLVRSSPVIALFLAEGDDATHWVEAGRSFERFVLAATARGIRHAHVNMPCEEVELRGPLCEAVGESGMTPLLLVRLGYAQAMPRSPRRPRQAVMLEPTSSDRLRKPWARSA